MYSYAGVFHTSIAQSIYADSAWHQTEKAIFFVQGHRGRRIPQPIDFCFLIKLPIMWRCSAHTTYTIEAQFRAHATRRPRSTLRLCRAAIPYANIHQFREFGASDYTCSSSSRLFSRFRLRAFVSHVRLWHGFGLKIITPLFYRRIIESTKKYETVKIIVEEGQSSYFTVGLAQVLGVGEIYGQDLGIFGWRNLAGGAPLKIFYYVLHICWCEHTWQEKNCNRFCCNRFARNFR